MVYTDYDLRKLQRIQLLILLEVKRICDKHGIHYFLIEGSLLGAVRHHGFIPWDDDIDVGMMREEYIKFINVCESELSSEFFLQTKETDEHCSLPWAKLQLNGTKRVDKSVAWTQTHVGIDIDIFPYDNIPSSSFFQCIHSNICWMLRGIYGIKCGYVVLNREKSLKKRLGSMVCRIVAVFFSKPWVSEMMDRHFQKYNAAPKEFVMNLSSSYSYKRERVNREAVSHQTQLSFEGYLLPCPMEYEKILANVYGDDYMILPPEEKRVQHAIINLDFGIYANIPLDQLPGKKK